jgi:hypothetical protein
MRMRLPWPRLWREEPNCKKRLEWGARVEYYLMLFTLDFYVEECGVEDRKENNNGKIHTQA